MGYDFNADDIFEMAVQLERNGAKFYRDAAKTISDPQAQAMLLGLAQMEDEHQSTFAAMRAELTASEKGATVFDPKNEAVLYLRALADTRVFFEKTIDTTSMKDILKAAIEAEKDSILFYMVMKESVPAKLGKSRLDEIIREEMSHVRLLGKELLKYGRS